MADDHDAAHQPFGFRRTDIVLPHHFEHAGAGQAGKDRHDHGAQDKAGQDQVPHGIAKKPNVTHQQRVDQHKTGAAHDFQIRIEPRTGGKNLAINGQSIDEDQRQPVNRHGDANQRARSGHQIDPGVAPQRRNDANTDADDHANDHTHHNHLNGCAEAVFQLVHHRGAIDDRGAQITAHNAPHPFNVLHVDRAVKAHLFAHPFNVFRAGAFTQHDNYWVTRNHADQHKND